MIEQVSKIILHRIHSSMERITNRKEVVRECSLLFKEQNYGKRKWKVETTTNGLSNLLPFFAF